MEMAKECCEIDCTDISNKWSQKQLKVVIFKYIHEAPSNTSKWVSTLVYALKTHKKISKTQLEHVKVVVEVLCLQIDIEYSLNVETFFDLYMKLNVKGDSLPTISWRIVAW